MSADWLTDDLFNTVFAQATEAPLDALDQLLWCILHTEGALGHARANASIAALQPHPEAQHTLAWLLAEAAPLWQRVQETQAEHPDGPPEAYIDLTDLRWFLCSVAWLRPRGMDNPMVARYALYLNWERATPDHLIVSSMMDPTGSSGFGVLLDTEGCDPWPGLPDHMVPQACRDSWEAGYRYADDARGSFNDEHSDAHDDEYEDDWE